MDNSKMRSKKQKIDETYTEQFIRRLQYWLHGEDPECAAAISDDGYTAGNTAFANDVCSLLEYLDSVRHIEAGILEKERTNDGKE